jgi:LysR family transcriptional regulator, transcriptional activator of nhaA
MEWLNYHHLLYFWLVAKEGGLVPAGRILRLSQPTLSEQIRKLEQSLGEQLFERRGRRLVLTEVGRVAYRYADEIFGIGGELLEAVRGRGTGRTSRLTVGVVDAVPKLLVRHVLEPAMRLPTPVTLICREDRIERLMVELANHAVDVVIADAPVPPGSPARAYNHMLGESGVTLLGPRALAVPLRRSFPRSLEEAPLLLPLADNGLRRALDGWFAGLHIRPRVVAEAEDSALLAAFAADGMGLVFAPTVVADVVSRRYGLVRVADVDGIRERYYAISGERRLVHPAVLAIREAARTELFPPRP